MRIRFILCFVTYALVSVSAQVKLSLTDGWQFIRMDMANTWEVFRPVQAGKPESVPLWSNITLPHCYNAEDGVDPAVNYYQGPAWYRRTLHVNNPYPDGHTLLQFEGTGQKTEVYVGHQKMGSHIGGYDRWTVDITAAGKGDLPLAIRCDNSRDVELIPSDMSDFCLYGGLYRPVYLVYMPSDYLDDVRIDVERNRVTIDPSHLLHVVLIAPDGKTVYQGDNRQPITVKKPQFWDVNAPYLYTARITYGEQTIEKRFGFRYYEFQKHGPFYLNGRRLLLQGTHRHEDHAGVGAAMTDAMIRHEMQQIKDMGVNFIRVSFSGG